jgi:hypothetical protein
VTYRILSFDGGPSVATTVRCLLEIETKHRGFLERTEHFVGSSAGAQVAVYLAYELSNGHSGLKVLKNAVGFVDELLEQYVPPGPEAYLRLLEGDQSMMTNQRVGTWLEEQIGGGMLLSELGKRISVLSTRADAPWGPEMCSNFSGLLTEVVVPEDAVNKSVQSGSFPLWLPLRDGHADGALFSNCPAMAGFAAAMASMESALARAEFLESSVVFSLGGMDGSSLLSNIWCPPMDTNAPQPDALPAAPVRIKRETLVSETQAKRYVGDARARLIHELNDKLGTAIPDGTTPFPVAGNASWGWQQWLAYPWNLGFFLQVWMNSMGRGVNDITRQLIGPRAFRLGPVTLLGTNEPFLCELMGLTDPIISFAEYTSDLWAQSADNGNPLKLTPDCAQTSAWIETHWMVDDPQEVTTGPFRVGV